jgi:hypothetical protein
MGSQIRGGSPSSKRSRRGCRMAQRTVGPSPRNGPIFSRPSILFLISMAKIMIWPRLATRLLYRSNHRQISQMSAVAISRHITAFTARKLGRYVKSSFSSSSSLYPIACASLAVRLNPRRPETKRKNRKMLSAIGRNKEYRRIPGLDRAR